MNILQTEPRFARSMVLYGITNPADGQNSSGVQCASPNLSAPTNSTVPLSYPRNDSLLSCNADRKSTRLNSSHQIISYAVFCLKKKKIIYENNHICTTI